MNNDRETSLKGPSNVSGNNSLHLQGSFPQLNRIYVFTPVDVTAKWALCALFSTIGCLGFFGNCPCYFTFFGKSRKEIQFKEALLCKILICM